MMNVPINTRINITATTEKIRVNIPTLSRLQNFLKNFGSNYAIDTNLCPKWGNIWMTGEDFQIELSNP
jgi:hypothetical protein